PRLRAGRARRPSSPPAPSRSRSPATAGRTDTRSSLDDGEAHFARGRVGAPLRPPLVEGARAADARDGAGVLAALLGVEGADQILARVLEERGAGLAAALAAVADLAELVDVE